MFTLTRLSPSLSPSKKIIYIERERERARERAPSKHPSQKPYGPGGPLSELRSGGQQLPRQGGVVARQEPNLRGYWAAITELNISHHNGDL